MSWPSQDRSMEARTPLVTCRYVGSEPDADAVELGVRVGVATGADDLPVAVPSMATGPVVAAHSRTSIPRTTTAGSTAVTAPRLFPVTVGSLVRAAVTATSRSGHGGPGLPPGARAPLASPARRSGQRIGENGSVPRTSARPLMP